MAKSFFNKNDNDFLISTEYRRIYQLLGDIDLSIEFNLFLISTEYRRIYQLLGDIDLSIEFNLIWY
jgi:hypothetical protein